MSRKCLECGAPDDFYKMYKRVLSSRDQLQQENTQLKSDLQALRERLKSVEWCIDAYWDNNGEKALRSVCSACRGLYEVGHKEGCWLKTDIDKLKGDE